jgi:hypothetical protein
VGSDDDGIVVAIQREKFDVLVVPVILGDLSNESVFFDGETTTILQIAAGLELDENDESVACPFGAQTEVVPGAVLDPGLHRVATDAGDEHAGFDGGSGGLGPADFLGGGFRSCQQVSWSWPSSTIRAAKAGQVFRRDGSRDISRSRRGSSIS